MAVTVLDIFSNDVPTYVAVRNKVIILKICTAYTDTVILTTIYFDK